MYVFDKTFDYNNFFILPPRHNKFAIQIEGKKKNRMEVLLWRGDSSI